MIVPTSAIILVLVFGIFCFGYAFSADWLSGQTSSMNRLDYISQTRFYIALSNVDLVLQYSQEHGKLQYYIDAMKGLMRSTDPVFINVLDDMLREMLLFTNNASTKFQELINNIAELSLIGEDIYSFAGSLLKPEKSVYSCGGPRGKAGLYNISISGLIAMSISHQREFAGRDSVYNLMKEPTYCELFLNFQVFYEETTALFDKVCDYQRQSLRI
ncbi:hypothetical protein TVAG_406780 [Trichomonas vaginalis G3]|uniref:Uncharacterized protein n=1 Tax=Trichomonas vaginalis (strain ATCC PRA-98 / G3) TaxID=412133 RepID=A2FIC8_TRIV3|nr:guanylate cyclase protein [Trichomonas vaginalis G3]EAX95330.1 hypothetical protein TVAG_406780 [Trichomonas vaginalis G3]KAI5550556.1 guanylate cyclase protein [Trichomonas vaginalis G3]|eukprot:XP_001308260.1 hypothetical protein [Trichomonas vaginalis G3]